MNKRILIAASTILVLQACGTTDPGTAAAISYTMPKTTVKTSVAIDILTCTPEVVSDSLFTVNAEAGSQNQPYELSGSLLYGGMAKRNLTITTFENGVISGVNSTSTDQSSVALGSVIKIVGSALPFFGTEGGRKAVTLRCRPEILEIAKSVKVLKQLNIADQKSILTQEATAADGIQQLRDNPTKQNAKSPSTDIANLQKNIDARALKIASLKTSLHAVLNADIKLEDKQLRTGGYQVSWDIKEIKKYFDVDYVGPGAAPPQDQRDSDILRFFETTATISEASALPATLDNTSKQLAECKQSILIPNAKPISLGLTATGKLFSPIVGAPPKTSSQIIYAAQLSEPTTLCLSTRFGESRTVNLKFDKFGRTSEFTWNAESKVANSLSAVAGYSTDTTASVKAFRGADLAKDKIELDELTTKRALQKAKICDAVIEAGGTTCPN